MSKFKNVNLIPVQEWDELVTRVYGKPYNFQQQDGCKERGVVWEECPSEGYDYEKDEIPVKVNGDVMGVSFKTWLETPADKRWFKIAILICGHIRDYDHYKNSQSKANETLLNAFKDALEDVHIESGRKEEHENVVNQIYKSILLAFNARG